MSWFRLPRTDWPYVAGGALLVVSSYPPFHLFLPSFLCLVPAVWLLLDAGNDLRPMRRRFAQGFWFGLLSHGLILYWMVVALWHFTPMSALGYAATISILAAWTGLLFMFVGWVGTQTPVPVALAFPVAWTALDWIIGHQGDIRFPWLGLGTSLTGYPVVVQIADLVGARGVTFLLAGANAVLAVAWLRRSDRSFVLRSVGGVVLGVLLAAGYGAWRMSSVPTRVVGRVAAVQPSIGFGDKQKLNLFDAIFDSLAHMSQRGLDSLKPQLIAWPEASVPYFFEYFPRWSPTIAEQARASGTPIVVGGLGLTRTSDSAFDYYNSAFFYDAAGKRDTLRYDKRFLVPIVERVPFVNPEWFSGINFFGGFGIGRPGPVYQIDIGKFGVLICYESAFPEESREYRRNGADFLLNITNDAWFGRSAAPFQHKAHLVMRAIENRVGIARAANNGISEFVDPFGRTYHETKLDEVTVIADDVLTTDITTLHVKVGDWVGVLSVLSTVGLFLWARRKRISGSQRVSA